MRFLNLLLISFLASCSLSNNEPHFEKNLTLKSITDNNKTIGVSVLSEQLFSNNNYQSFINSEFSGITPENAMKMETINPTKGMYNFRDADEIVRWAESNKKVIRGHPIIWHRQVPSYLKNLDNNQLKEIFESHILTIVKRYQNSVFIWDIVNEAINSDGTLRKSIWLKHLGPDYIKDAFILAHHANPKAKLFYNDYDLTMPGPKFDSAYELIKDLLKKKIPIHGIGLQMHLRPEFKQSEEGLRLVIQKFSELGLEIHLTEIDIAIPTPSSLNDREEQARTFQFIGSVCNQFPSCTSLSLWGLNDTVSWIPSHFKGLGEATLLDGNMNKKSTYYEFLKGLESRN